VESRHTHGESAARSERKQRWRAVSTQVGAAVRKLRADQGVSQEQLAERAGLHAKYVSRVENRSVNLTLASLVALADALGVDVQQLCVTDAGVQARELESSTNDDPESVLG